MPRRNAMKKLLLAILFCPSLAFAQSAAYNLSQLAHNLAAGGYVKLDTSVTAILPCPNGGTGVSTAPTNGEILIGNGSCWTPATITAGSGITITNAAGSITIAATGVTSVGMTVPSWLTVTGSPITTNGTLAVTATGSQVANEFLATPNGTAGALGLRAIVSADLPVALSTVTSVNGTTVPASAGTLIGTGNLGTGVDTWLGTPTLGNLNTALGMSLPTLAATQTFTGVDTFSDLLGLPSYATASLPTCTPGQLAYADDGTGSITYCNNSDTWVSGGGTQFTYTVVGCPPSAASGDATGGSITLAPCAAPTQTAPATANTGGTLSGASSPYYYEVTATTPTGETTVSNQESVALTPLGAPTNGALTATAGGTLAATTYYVESTWTTANGQTMGATETSLAVAADDVLNVAAPASPPAAATGWDVYVSTATGTETLQASGIGTTTAWVEPTTGLVAGAALPTTNTAFTNTNEDTVNWDVVTGASGYKVYRSASSGMTSATYYAVSGGSTVTFLDTGAAGTSGQPPTTNTTAASSVTVAFNGAVGMTAAHLWDCGVGDQTLQAAGTWFGRWGQSSSTTTTATIPIPPAAGATDTITFTCTPH